MKKGSSASQYAILGFLGFGPMSGYDIKQTVERSVRHFWNESYGQIYPLLKRMSAEGLAVAKTERNHGKPDRKVYSITPKGKKQLQDWLAHPAKAQPSRNELLLKIFFSGKENSANDLRQLERTRAEHAALLSEYLNIESDLRHRRAPHPQLPYWLMTLDFGKRRSQAIVDWCDQSIKTLRHLSSKSPNKKRRN